MEMAAVMRSRRAARRGVAHHRGASLLWRVWALRGAAWGASRPVMRALAPPPCAVTYPRVSQKGGAWRRVSGEGCAEVEPLLR